MKKLAKEPFFTKSRDLHQAKGCFQNGEVMVLPGGGDS